jgi:hypothetical protein
MNSMIMNGLILKQITEMGVYGIEKTMDTLYRYPESQYS